MSLFFTLSFEMTASEAKAERVVKTVRDYLAQQGARDVLFTHSGEHVEEEDEEEEERPKSRSRR